MMKNTMVGVGTGKSITVVRRERDLIYQMVAAVKQTFEKNLDPEREKCVTDVHEFAKTEDTWEFAGFSIIVETWRSAHRIYLTPKAGFDELPVAGTDDWLGQIAGTSDLAYMFLMDYILNDRAAFPADTEDDTDTEEY